MCKGLIKAHPELDLSKVKVVKKKEINKKGKPYFRRRRMDMNPLMPVCGKGMLDAAVCGDVFASPSIKQVYTAITKTDSQKGTLLIVKNYSGDCMNFNEAAELAREDDIEVDAVYVNDDIAVTDSLYTVGRRGVAGTVFVHKIAGAAAEEGRSLAEVKAVANKTIQNVRSIGFALTSCTVPAKGTPTFEIGDDEMEYGVGIHGEPGRQRMPVAKADELAANMVNQIDLDMPISGQEVALMINGFGGTPLQELYLFNNSVSNEVEKKGAKIYKTFVGNFMTSIDMDGASVTILNFYDELKLCLMPKPILRHLRYRRQNG